MTPNYALPSMTILDENVSVWSLVKYVFKWMFAFILVNIILTVPVVLGIAFLAALVKTSMQH